MNRIHIVTPIALLGFAEHAPKCTKKKSIVGEEKDRWNVAFADLLGSLAGMFGGGDTPAATPGMTQPQQGGGGGMGDLFGALLSGPGTMLASRLIGRGEQKDIDKMQKNIRGSANTASAAGQEMVNRASRGELTAPQQASVDKLKAEQNARMQQRFAQMGIPISTMQTQAAGQVDQEAAAFAQKLINDSFQQGISAMQLGSTASQSLLNSAVQQRKDMADAIGGVTKEIGRIFGGNKPTTPGTPPTASASVPEEWRSTEAARPWDEDLSSGWA